MRIIQPSRKPKAGSKLKLSQSSDSNIESDDFAYADRKNSKKNRINKDNKPKCTATKSEFGLGRNDLEKLGVEKAGVEKEGLLKAQPQAEPTEFSDGRKRRRSEFGDVSFFNNLPGKPEEGKAKAEKGDALSDADLAELFAPLDDKKKEFNRLFASGMRLLGVREHSVNEITNKLLAKTELPDVAYAVVDELLENKYLSDERFAESFVRARLNKGFGPIKILSELKNRGINNQLIADYLDMNSAVWFDSARDQHNKKYGVGQVANYSDWTKRARFLQSRGFTMEHIHCAVTKPESD